LHFVTTLLIDCKITLNDLDGLIELIIIAQNCIQFLQHWDSTGDGGINKKVQNIGLVIRFQSLIAYSYSKMKFKQGCEILATSGVY